VVRNGGLFISSGTSGLRSSSDRRVDLRGGGEVGGRGGGGLAGSGAPILAPGVTIIANRSVDFGGGGGGGLMWGEPGWRGGH
jgi:hypothetical protein